MDTNTWAELIYVPEKMNLRTPGSKHQKKIREILYLVGLVKDHPNDSIYDKLMNIPHINCPKSESDPVNYCRYLQVCLNILRCEGMKE